MIERHLASRPALGDRSVSLTAAAAVALTAALAQVIVVDRLEAAPFGHLDLALAGVVAVILADPNRSAVVALVAGLTVDAFGRRLFGLHCVAFAVVGPVLGVLTASLRPSGRRVIVGVAPAVLAASASAGVVSAAVAVVDRRFDLGVVVDPLATGLLSGALAAPLQLTARRGRR